MVARYVALARKLHVKYEGPPAPSTAYPRAAFSEKTDVSIGPFASYMGALPRSMNRSVTSPV